MKPNAPFGKQTFTTACLLLLFKMKKLKSLVAARWKERFGCPMPRLLSYVCPFLKQKRRSDGVRGVFALKDMPRGALLFSAPLRYSCWPYGFHTQLEFKEEDKLDLHYYNCHSKLFADYQFWLHSFGCTRMGSSGRDEWEASASTDEDGVMSLQLSPVECALAACIALTYFWKTNSLARVCIAGRGHCGVGMSFVNSLPIEQLLEQGVESLCWRESSAGTHICLEQIARSVADNILGQLTMEAYRFIDTNLEYFCDLILTCLYLVRSYTLPVKLLAPASSSAADLDLFVMVPGVHCLNHSDSPTAAAAASRVQSEIVVRSLVDLKRGSEITLNYKTSNAHSCKTLFEERYLLPY